jgi:hypothetical protein
MDKEPIRLSIAQDFTKTPGLRYISESKFSGEDFRERLLKPKFLEAVKDDKHLEIILDGTQGYATSFLEESFGGLARSCVKEYSPEDILKRMIFISSEEEYLKAEIEGYIKNGSN